MEELYYWVNNEGKRIPKHELSNCHVCNIVMKFGKDWLASNGHQVIVDRFDGLNKQHSFFSAVSKEGK